MTDVDNSSSVSDDCKFLRSNIFSKLQISVTCFCDFPFTVTKRNIFMHTLFVCLCILSPALSSSTDVADSLHNLVLVEQFCRRLSMPITHLTLNDLFYSVNELLPNIIAFLADLFHCLESLGFDNFQPPDVKPIPGNLSTVTGIF